MTGQVVDFRGKETEAKQFLSEIEKELPNAQTAIVLIRNKEKDGFVIAYGGDKHGDDILVLQRILALFVEAVFLDGVE